jgi:hypothetical protein
MGENWGIGELDGGGRDGVLKGKVFEGGFKVRIEGGREGEIRR